MYKIPEYKRTSINRNESVEGETIEQDISRMLNNQEEIGDPTNNEPIYTERKEGVKEAYNIRHDKWITAQEAMDKTAKSYEAKRNDKIKERETPKSEEIED